MASLHSNFERQSFSSRHISEGQWGENRLKAERARFLTEEVRRAKPETEPLLIDLWPARRTQISGDSKGVGPLGRRAGVNALPEKGRQRAVRSEANVGRGKAKLFPLRGARRGKSGVFSVSTVLSFLKHTRRPISSASLNRRFGKAKSSRPLLPFPCILPTQYGKEPFNVIISYHSRLIQRTRLPTLSFFHRQVLQSQTGHQECCLG